MEMETTVLFDRSDIHVFTNRPKSINQILTDTVKSFGHKLAIVDENRSLTYTQMQAVSSNIAANLQVNYGIEKGDRVATLVGNRVEFSLMVFACAKLGAILVPINVRLKTSEIEYILGNCQPRALIVEKQYVEKLIDIKDKTMDFQLFVIEGENSFSKLEKFNTDLTPVSINEEDAMFILYTSGTTGKPKGAVISHVNVIHSLLNYNKILKTDYNMKTLIAVPIYHVTGLIGQFLHMCSIGGTSYCMKRYQNDSYINLVQKYQINFLFNVPTIFLMLATTEAFQKKSFDFVRKVAFGGAPIYQETYNLLRRAFPNADLHNAYGATETTSPTTLMPINYSESKVNSVGLAVNGAQIKIINSSGKECLEDEVGELFIKGPMVVKGYWKNTEANESDFEDGYWKSGDIGSKDADGYFYIYDRKKDMINRGGENVFSIEVEDVLKSYPGVDDAAVVGIPDAIFGERIKAFIVGSKIDERDFLKIRNFCANQLAKYKVPEEIEILEELPRNQAGKVLKHVLRDK